MAVPSLLALPVYPSLRAPPRTRLALLVGLSLLVLSCFVIVPPEARFLRTVAAIWAVVVLMKAYDLHLGARAGDLPTFRQFLEFVPNIFSLVHRKLPAEPQPARRQDVKSLLKNGALAAAATLPAIVVFRANWNGQPFILEHAAKVVSMFLVLIPLLAVGSAAWRLAGGRARQFMDNPFAARTPADFWRRYNRPVHQFLQEDVFKPAGGPRKPAAAMLLVFVVSAAIHEFVFTAGTGKLYGYQTAFFLIQGVAVAATARVKPRGWRALLWTAATFAFNIATGVLFFGSVNQILPFYDNEPPLWD